MARNMITYGRRVFVHLHAKEEIFSRNNKIFVCGKVETRCYMFDEGSYRLKIMRKRPSGKKDYFWVVIPEKLNCMGKYVEVGGEFHEGYIFAKYYRVLEKCQVFPNVVYMEGRFLLPILYTADKKGTKFLQFLMKVEDDVIPCIAWNKMATYIKDMESGVPIVVLGRLESRVNAQGIGSRELCLSKIKKG